MLSTPCHNHTFRRSIQEIVCSSNITICLNDNNDIEILKNRYDSIKPKPSLEDLINILTEMLVRKIFRNNLDMFREGMKVQLIKSIKETIERSTTG